MCAAGVRNRVHAGRQREEAGKGGSEGEEPARKVQASGVPGPEEEPQHTQDIWGSGNGLLDDPRLAGEDARAGPEGQVQQEAGGKEKQVHAPHDPGGAGLAQEEPAKVRFRVWLVAA